MGIAALKPNVQPANEVVYTMDACFPFAGMAVVTTDVQDQVCQDRVPVEMGKFGSRIVITADWQTNRDGKKSKPLGCIKPGRTWSGMTLQTLGDGTVMLRSDTMVGITPVLHIAMYPGSQWQQKCLAGAVNANRRVGARSLLPAGGNDPHHVVIDVYSEEIK